MRIQFYNLELLVSIIVVVVANAGNRRTSVDIGTRLLGVFPIIAVCGPYRDSSSNSSLNASEFLGQTIGK